MNLPMISDLETLDFLERFILETKAAVLYVSHDRNFH